MNKDSRIFIAGHRGLVGSALYLELTRLGYTHLITRSRAELDLFDTAAVNRFFSDEKPEYVFLAAARVGGILANNTCPADFLRDNLILQTNVIDASYRNHVQRLLFLASSAIYPRLSAQPIQESSLLTGSLEPTNRSYALAKLAGIEMCWSYNRQYGTRYLTAIPSNLYGPGDHYDATASHVLPALLRKTVEAVRSNAPTITVWGTGTPRRELLYSGDLAEACIFLMTLDEDRYTSLLTQDEPPVVNVGTGEDVTIRELAETIARVLEFKGSLVFDSTKPDGIPRKLMDGSRLQGLGWKHRTTLEEGIRLTWAEVQHRL